MVRAPGSRPGGGSSSQGPHPRSAAIRGLVSPASRMKVREDPAKVSASRAEPPGGKVGVSECVGHFRLPARRRSSQAQHVAGYEAGLV